uniref:non-histone chromosomal protein HMG-14 n=1 Tax=Myodes glareolus TaxID=447135 RepID=UPI002020E49B|nr:non-histone chromosomal protein HMG-14 [Myodes glareolus]
MGTTPPRPPAPAHCSPAPRRRRPGARSVSCACAGAQPLRQHHGNRAAGGSRACSLHLSGAQRDAPQPKRRSARLSAKPAPAKVDAKPKKAAGKDKSSDKKVQAKGKRGAKGKQAEVADQQTADLPTENGETENQSPASEGEEKEAKSD